MSANTQANAEFDLRPLESHEVEIVSGAYGLQTCHTAVGDDAQLANVDLQNWLQKQDQTLQMMSNISKMLYDTTLAVIRKIGG